ncbi:hypothetical protein GCM10023176_10040 [Micromonospora coerulea]|uniref:Uncharacterized protein n=1 Tax=Micromonospora coerulea TaxID=47856 RepID=A0ABP8S8A0_9ACTN
MSIRQRLSRNLLTAAAGGLLAAIAFAAPAAAQDSVQSTVSYTALSAGRLGAISAALLGLTGVVIGWLALARPTSRFGTSSGTLGAKVALAAGLIGMALGGLVAGTSDAGIGTGNGRAGAYVALLVGLIATLLGARALTRSRRTATPANRSTS